MAERYYRGQGSVFVSDRDPVTGQPVSGFRFLGNVSMLKISTTTQQIKHKESYTGQGLTDLVIETQKEASIMLTIEDFSKENLELALFGTATLIPGATVSAEAINVYPGRSTPLANINLTTFTSLTNGGTALIAGTDYTVDLKAGMISIPKTGSAIIASTPVQANYVTANSEKVSAFTKPNREYWLRFNGLNSAESDSPVVIDVYRARFNPQKEWALIDDNLSTMELDGEILYDAKQIDTATDGRFFRERQMAA